MSRISSLVTGSFLGAGTTGQVAVYGADGRLSGTTALSVSSGAVTIGVAAAGALHTLNGDLRIGGTTAASAASVYRNSTTGFLSIQGDSSATPSAINIYGSSHASLASIIRFVSANTTSGEVSALGQWTIQPSGTSQVPRINTATTAAGVAAATLANAPAGDAGNPDLWVNLNFNGTLYVVPAWTP